MLVIRKNRNTSYILFFLSQKSNLLKSSIMSCDDTCKMYVLAFRSRKTCTESNKTVVFLHVPHHKMLEMKICFHNYVKKDGLTSGNIRTTQLSDLQI